MRILVLDDDTTLLETVSSILAEYGHEVECVDNSKAALQKTETSNYDLILVDYKLPVNDGIWFMRNANIPKETRVLLVTAYVNRQVIKTMFDLGASGYIIKPFDEPELMRNLEFYCSADEQTSQAC